MPSVVLDGIRTHHFRTEPAGDAAETIAELVDALARTTPGPEALAALHERLTEQQALSIADDLVAELSRRRSPRDGLHRVARYLAEHGTRREPVKIGVVLLGVSGGERDRDLLLLLGVLEELTLYAVVALGRTQPDRWRATFELAQRVRGWGRIHAVERLKGCDDQDVKDWLLREGFRNGVMNEYLAHLAATTGGLFSALRGDDVDDALLDGAGAILAALAMGGPAEDLRDYDDALPALHRYAELMAGAEPSLRRLDDLLTIAALTKEPDPGWPADQVVTARFRTLLERPAWGDVVRGVLADPADEYAFNVALSCAGRLGLPVLPDAMAWLENDPLNGYVWQWVLRHAGPDTVTDVTYLAERLIPLDGVDTGPDRNAGFGPAHAAERALEVVVGGLTRHPGAGLTLLRAALASRVIQLRRAAFRTLAAWPPDSRPDRALDWVDTAARRESNDELRDEMTVFLIEAASRPAD